MSESQLQPKQQVQQVIPAPATPEIMGQNPVAFATLFPGSTPPKLTLFGPSGKYNIEDVLAKGEGMAKGKVVPLLIVCATYHTAFSKTTHQTSLVEGVWDVGDSVNLDNWRAIVPDKERPIPASRLHLAPYRGVGGSFAN